MITTKDPRCTVETIELDGKEYRLFHLTLFAGTDKETEETVAEYALNAKIEEMIENEDYSECRGIDERYGYYLPKEVDTNDVDSMIESIEDVYESNEADDNDTTPLTIQEDESFENRLDSLGKEALSKAKEALRALGGIFIIDNPVFLHIDTCNGSGFLYELKARKVRLEGDTINIIGDISKEREKEIFEDDQWDDVQPEEVWTFGGEWYAEWEGLLQVLDKIIEEKRRNETDTKKFSVTCTLIYNGEMEVEATDEEDAVNKAQQLLNRRVPGDLPDSGSIGGVPFTYGEATADFAERTKPVRSKEKTRALDRITEFRSRCFDMANSGRHGDYDNVSERVPVFKRGKKAN